MTAASVEREGTLLRLRGPLNLASVPTQYAACLPAAGAAGLIIDLAEAEPVDSSALALLIGLRRAVEEAGGHFQVRNVPDALHTLAGLYGVGFLIDNTLPAA